MPVRLVRAMMLATLLAGGAAAAQNSDLSAGTDAPGWAVFNSRAGTRVEYPSNIFTREAGPARRGSGVELRSDDERARLMIYAEANDENQTPAEFVRSKLKIPQRDLDYRRITERFFAISGYNGDDVYYSRCNFPSGSAGPMHCIYMTYPRAEERAWDPIVTRISRSLRNNGG